MRGFDPSRPSHAVLRSASLPRRRENGPEIPAFRAFVLVSGLPVCRTRGGNRRKSPAVSSNIPVLGRLSAETGWIRTAARSWHSAHTSSLGPTARNWELAVRIAARREAAEQTKKDRNER